MNSNILKRVTNIKFEFVPFCPFNSFSKTVSWYFIIKDKIAVGQY